MLITKGLNDDQGLDDHEHVQWLRPFLVAGVGSRPSHDLSHRSSNSTPSMLYKVESRKSVPYYLK